MFAKFHFLVVTVGLTVLVLADLAQMAPSTSSRPVPQARNYQGCDKVLGYQIDSCGSKGACCDVHDDCYKRNSCTASSWYWTLPGGACDRCNGAVVACITSENPGPSRCCPNNCGKPGKAAILP